MENLAENNTRTVVQRWFTALSRGDGAAALACLDDDIDWDNNPGIPGLSDIVPWLGHYRGAPAVAETFRIWADVSSVQAFELRRLTIDGDRALAVVHEIGLIKSTGLTYDIEFIQSIRVAGNSIVEWKSYWDTARAIPAFVGNGPARLAAAVAAGDLPTAQMLLHAGVNPNTIGDDGLPVLMIAAGTAQVDMARLLLNAGADPCLTDRGAGATALHKACQRGSLEMVRLLLERGSLLDTPVASTGHTPLIEAIWFKWPDIVAHLLERGAGIHARTSYGFTLLDHLAYALKVNQVGQEKLEAIAKLIHARQAQEERTIASQSLMTAVMQKDLAAVRTLLNGGAPADERAPILNGFNDAHTPLLVASRDGTPEIVEALLAAGADVNAVEPTFWAVPLHKAVYNGHLEITRLLCRHPEVDLNRQGKTNGYTPLLDALWHGFADCAQVLIDAGANLSLAGHDGATPLSQARDMLGADHPVTRDIERRLQSIAA